ncbi:hypothetical protein ACWG0P_02480 [Amedibacillus sp. YH-ame6]
MNAKRYNEDIKIANDISLGKHINCSAKMAFMRFRNSNRMGIQCSMDNYKMIEIVKYVAAIMVIIISIAVWIVSYWNLLSSLVYPGKDTINIFAGLFTKICFL